MFHDRNRHDGDTYSRELTNEYALPYTNANWRSQYLVIIPAQISIRIFLVLTNIQKSSAIFSVNPLFFF